MRYVLLLLLAACTSNPTPTSEPRPVVVVNASPDALWSATLAAFTDQSIPITTADRSGGVVTTAEVVVPNAEATTLADCGRAMGAVIHAGHVRYTAVVNASGVRVTAAYTYGNNAGRCASRGAAEARIEAAIKQRAEAH